MPQFCAKTAPLSVTRWRRPSGRRLRCTFVSADALSLDLRRTLAIAQIVSGDYDQAIEHLRRVLSVDPDYPHASLLLARTLGLSGRLEEAQGICSTRGAPGRIWAAQMYVKAGRREEAERLLDVNDLPHRQAVVFAALGDKARTLEALNRAAVTVPQRTVIMLVYPEMAFLRGDPGLALLRKKLNLQYRRHSPRLISAHLHGLFMTRWTHSREDCGG